MDPVIPPLNSTEVRVLGSLVEKAVTTPEYYPLSADALTNACNQRSSREPVVSFDPSEVVRALDGLRDRKLATVFHGAESRVPKYKHLLTDAFLLTPAEVAVLCVLMLRGPQTAGELRSRTERLHSFDSLAEVEETLTALAAHAPAPLAAKLARQPGTKESRWSHLFSGAVEAAASERPAEQAKAAVQPEIERLEKLEAEIVSLRQDVAEIKQQMAEFRRQFE